eukprot:TRINITY_DN3133_c0_g1_i3.p1 TRINITY_DN3133_c0_g1~~TRINITY_DN3133_c0_g1_i3.p1  ORF type:complete len:372 (+),score=72.62 TRINITY_DN3133_c0_g1_i3:3-1118(+)
MNDGLKRYCQRVLSRQQLYEVGDEIGRGAYSVVFSAVSLKSGERVALKLIYEATQESNYARKFLREVKIMKLFKHSQYVLGLKDIFNITESDKALTHLVLITELLECDLNTLIYHRPPEELLETRRKVIMLQLLRGLAELHSIGIIHRDLRPKNILIKGSTVKICDFGMSRSQSKSMSLLSNISHLWYTAPECISANNSYSCLVDIWCSGVIFYEMCMKTEPFQGKSGVVSQFEAIFKIFGTPPQALLEKLCSTPLVLKHLLTLPQFTAKPLSEFLPHEDPLAHSFFSQLCALNPDARATAQQALAHPYLAETAAALPALPYAKPMLSAFFRESAVCSSPVLFARLSQETSTMEWCNTPPPKPASTPTPPT